MKNKLTLVVFSAFLITLNSCRSSRCHFNSIELAKTIRSEVAIPYISNVEEFNVTIESPKLLDIDSIRFNEIVGIHSQSKITVLQVAQDNCAVNLILDSERYSYKAVIDYSKLPYTVKTAASEYRIVCTKLIDVDSFTPDNQPSAPKIRELPTKSINDLKHD